MLSDDERRRFLEAVAALIPVVNAHQGKGQETRTGAWVCIRDRAQGDATMVHEPVGTMAPDSSELRQRASRIKVEMLCENPGIVTSFEVRDPDQGRWGGGFHWQGVDYAISGFPEDWDLAGGLCVCCMLGRMSPMDAVRIAAQADGALNSLTMLETHRRGSCHDRHSS